MAVLNNPIGGGNRYLTNDFYRSDGYRPDGLNLLDENTSSIIFNNPSNQKGSTPTQKTHPGNPISINPVEMKLPGQQLIDQSLYKKPVGSPIATIKPPEIKTPGNPIDVATPSLNLPGSQTISLEESGFDPYKNNKQLGEFDTTAEVGTLPVDMEKDITGRVKTLDETIGKIDTAIEGFDSGERAKELSGLIPTEGRDAVLKGMDDLYKIFTGESPAMEATINQALGRFGSSASASQLAQAARISADPNMTSGAKNAAMSELARNTGMQRSELIGSLAVAQQQMQFEALNNFTQSGMNLNAQDSQTFTNMLNAANTEFVNTINGLKASGDLTSAQITNAISMVTENNSNIQKNLDREFNKIEALARNELAMASNDIQKSNAEYNMGQLELLKQKYADEVTKTNENNLRTYLKENVQTGMSFDDWLKDEGVSQWMNPIIRERLGVDFDPEDPVHQHLLQSYTNGIRTPQEQDTLDILANMDYDRNDPTAVAEAEAEAEAVSRGLWWIAKTGASRTETKNGWEIKDSEGNLILGFNEETNSVYDKPIPKTVDDLTADEAKAFEEYNTSKDTKDKLTVDEWLDAKQPGVDDPNGEFFVINGEKFSYSKYNIPIDTPKDGYKGVDRYVEYVKSTGENAQPYDDWILKPRSEPKWADTTISNMAEFIGEEKEFSQSLWNAMGKPETAEQAREKLRTDDKAAEAFVTNWVIDGLADNRVDKLLEFAGIDITYDSPMYKAIVNNAKLNVADKMTDTTERYKGNDKQRIISGMPVDYKNSLDGQPTITGNGWFVSQGKLYKMDTVSRTTGSDNKDYKFKADPITYTFTDYLTGEQHTRSS